ncbi:MAG: GNVR domain-containing protein [bacterium]
MLFLLKTIIQWRKFILLVGLAFAAIAAIVSFLLPSWFVANASLFPPDTGSAMPRYADLLQQSLQLPIVGPNAMGARPNTIYIDILLSRKIGEQILDEFNLKKVYGAQLTPQALGALRAHTKFTLLDNGLLKIGFEDRDPERAAAVVNRYVELLDEFNRDYNISRASKTKEFVGEQLEVHERDLREAEEELKNFQMEHEALVLDQQVKASIDIVASLTAEAVALEVDLEILRQYASTASEEYVRKKKEYDEIRRQLGMFKADSARVDDDLVRSYFPTFDTLPETALELARLTRRVKTLEAVHGMLIKEYETARVEEARDTPTVQVLDWADVPELRSRPKRKMVVALGGAAGLAWGGLIALFVTAWREDRARGGHFMGLFSPFVGDFKRIFRRNR